jgi:Tol biopolymer transport system component
MALDAPGLGGCVASLPASPDTFPMSLTFLRSSRALLLCALLFACSDDPTNPGTGGGLSGTLDFNESSTRSSIFTIDLASGSASTTLNGYGPHRTPDGTVLMVSPNGDLVESNGTQQRLIVAKNLEHPNTQRHDDQIVNPRLSPNGRLVAYAGPLFTYNVYIVDRQTGALEYSIEASDTREGYQRPSWISDTQLLVGGYQTNPGLFVVDLVTGEVTRIDDNLAGPTDPIVSPDRTRAAFILNDHVWIMNLDGTGLRQITTSTGTESMPTWSPDGKWILVANTADLFAVPIDGGTTIDIMKTYRNDVDYLGGSTQVSWR